MQEKKEKGNILFQEKSKKWMDFPEASIAKHFLSSYISEFKDHLPHGKLAFPRCLLLGASTSKGTTTANQLCPLSTYTHHSPTAVFSFFFLRFFLTPERSLTAPRTHTHTQTTTRYNITHSPTYTHIHQLLHTHTHHVNSQSYA